MFYLSDLTAAKHKAILFHICIYLLQCGTDMQKKIENNMKNFDHDSTLSYEGRGWDFDCAFSSMT